MTELKRVEALMAELEGACQGSLGVADASKWLCAANALQPTLDKMRMKASEADPDKRVYGPKTAERIIAMHSRLQALTDMLAGLVGRDAGGHGGAGTTSIAVGEVAPVAAAPAPSTAASPVSAATSGASNGEGGTGVRGLTMLVRAGDTAPTTPATKDAAAVEAAVAQLKREQEARAKARAAAMAAAEAPPAPAPAAVKPIVAAAAPASSPAPTQPAASVPAAAPLTTLAPLSASLPSGVEYVGGVVHEVFSNDDLTAAIAAGGDRVVMVDYFAPWCGPCRAIAPAIATLAADMTDVLFVKIDVDPLPDVAATRHIRAFPTFHILFRNKLQAAFSGADLNRIRSSLAEAQGVAEEILLAEAMAASLEGEGESASATTAHTAVTPAVRGAGSAAPAPAPSGSGGAAAGVSGPVDVEAQCMAAACRVCVDEGRQGDVAALTSSLADLKRTLPLEQYTTAVRVVRDGLSNIVCHPTEAKYRTIKNSNATFQSRLGRHGATAVALLTAVGFVRESRAGEEYWTYNPACAAVVGESHAARCLAICEAALR